MRGFATHHLQQKMLQKISFEEDFSLVKNYNLLFFKIVNSGFNFNNLNNFILIIQILFINKLVFKLALFLDSFSAIFRSHQKNKCFKMKSLCLMEVEDPRISLKSGVKSERSRGTLTLTYGRRKTTTSRIKSEFERNSDFGLTILFLQNNKKGTKSKFHKAFTISSFFIK